MKIRTRYILSVIVLIISITVVFLPTKIVSMIDGVFSDKICLNQHCFSKPHGWTNTNRIADIVAYILGDAPSDRGSYILELSDGRKVILHESSLSSVESFPSHIQYKQFNKNCTYIYESHSEEKSEIIEIINYGITIYLPEDEKVKNEILAAICN